MNTTDRKHTAKRPLPLLLAAALMLLLPVACDKGIHDGEYPLPGGQGALVIGLESHAEVTDLTVCIFREGGAAPLYKVYADPRALARRLIEGQEGKAWVRHPLLDRWLAGQAARWQRLWR